MTQSLFPYEKEIIVKMENFHKIQSNWRLIDVPISWLIVEQYEGNDSRSTIGLKYTHDNM